jgi:hypothetical protein
VKDQYAGDIGDYFKLALLRAVAQGERVGVAWYRTPDDPASNNGKGDGRHTAYLQNPDRWRRFDETLFDKLKAVVDDGGRSIGSLEAILTGDYIFYDATVEKGAAREAWFTGLHTALAGCSVVFADPDNGIAPTGYRATRAKAVKSITLDEIDLLRQSGRTVIVYHHQTRRPGGHLTEAAYLRERLNGRGTYNIMILRAKAFSPRLFVVVNPSVVLRSRLESFARRWGKWLETVPPPTVTIELPDESPYSERAERGQIAFTDRIALGEYDAVLGLRPKCQ